MYFYSYTLTNVIFIKNPAGQSWIWILRALELRAAFESLGKVDPGAWPGRLTPSFSSCSRLCPALFKTCAHARGHPGLQMQIRILSGGREDRPYSANNPGVNLIHPHGKFIFPSIRKHVGHSRVWSSLEWVEAVKRSAQAQGTKGILGSCISSQSLLKKAGMDSGRACFWTSQTFASGRSYSKDQDRPLTFPLDTGSLLDGGIPSWNLLCLSF